MKTSIAILIMGLGHFYSNYAHAQNGPAVQLNVNTTQNYIWQNGNSNAPTNPYQYQTITMDPHQTANQPIVTPENSGNGNYDQSNPNSYKAINNNRNSADNYQKANKRCGNFGAMGCTGTEVTNQSANLLTTVSETAAAVKLNNDSANRKSELNQKIQSGIIVKNKDFNDVTRANIDQGIKQHNELGSQQLTTGATQTTLAILHSNSAQKLKKQRDDKAEEHDLSMKDYDAKQGALDLEIETETAKLTTAQAEYTAALNSGNSETIKTTKKNLDDINDKIAEAKSQKRANDAEARQEEADFKKYEREVNAEIAKQEEVAGATALGATQSIMKGSQHLIEASGMKGTKAAIQDVENSNNGTGTFSYTPQTNTGGNEGGLANAPTVETGAVTTDDPAGGLGLDGGIKDFNPNVGAGGATGPMAGAFKEDAMKAGGGQGSGLGGAGGTSASRGDGGGGEGQGGAPGKGQTGGQYASGDTGGIKFSRGGSSGGSGVGFSSGLSDLLKKMLPGNDEKKNEKASLDLASDRSPASDQAAVIGRNKNIFIEISKRYQKKNSEKAVYFQ